MIHAILLTLRELIRNIHDTLRGMDEISEGFAFITVLFLQFCTLWAVTGTGVMEGLPSHFWMRLRIDVPFLLALCFGPFVLLALPEPIVTAFRSLGIKGL